MDARQQFGANLRRLRLEKGLTQEDLAARADMSVPYLSDIERGRSGPSLDMLVDLANALQMHPAQLVEPLDMRQAWTHRKRPRP